MRVYFDDMIVDMYVMCIYNEVCIWYIFYICELYLYICICAVATLIICETCV